MTHYCLKLPYVEGVVDVAKKFATDYFGHNNEKNELIFFANQQDFLILIIN